MTTKSKPKDIIPTLQDIRKKWLKTFEGKKSGVSDRIGELRSYIAATTWSSTSRLEGLKEKIRSMELGPRGQEIYDSLVAMYSEIELLSLLATFLYYENKKS